MLLGAALRWRDPRPEVFVSNRRWPQVRPGEGATALKRKKRPEWPCTLCPPVKGSQCGALLRGAVREERQSGPRQSSYSAVPGGVIYRRGAMTDGAFAVCQGWALRFIQLSDGRRQNLAVLLPGDLCLTALFQDSLQFSVEAVTELRITRFARSDLKRKIREDANMLEQFGKACAAEQRDSDERAVNLGRRSAEERVANLMLGLVNRMSRQHFRPNHDYAFPLLQRHIADLTGLTPVHVSRVMTEFRHAGLMRLSRGLLTVANLAELEHIAQLL